MNSYQRLSQRYKELKKIHSNLLDDFKKVVVENNEQVARDYREYFIMRRNFELSIMYGQKNSRSSNNGPYVVNGIQSVADADDFLKKLDGEK